MKKSEVDKIYIEGFIKSMDEDFDKWELKIYSGLDVFYEYISPYYNDVIRYTFGRHIGAYVDGHLKWELPHLVLINPLNSYFWRYNKAKRKVKKYLLEKERQKRLNYLYESAKKIL